MSYTFEFDAPKYKCFGRQQLRRSTITDIDRKSIHDRWFLTTHQHEKIQSFQKQNTSRQQLNKNNKQTLKEAIKAQNPPKLKRMTKILNIQENKKKSNKKQIAKSQSVQANNYSIENTVKQKSRQLAPKKKLQKSKSQSNAQGKKITQAPRRNPPCLYPVRIQRQWQQKHGKNWYQLQTDEIADAQRSMRKRFNQQKPTSQNQIKDKLKNRNKQKVSKQTFDLSKEQKQTKKTTLKASRQNPVKDKPIAQKIKNPLYKQYNSLKR